MNKGENIDGKTSSAMYVSYKWFFFIVEDMDIHDKNTC